SALSLFCRLSTVPIMASIKVINELADPTGFCFLLALLKRVCVCVCVCMCVCSSPVYACLFVSGFVCMYAEYVCVCVCVCGCAKLHVCVIGYIAKYVFAFSFGVVCL